MNTVDTTSRLVLYTVKKVIEFPVPSRVVTTKLSLGGNNDVPYKLFLPRESLVSDIPAGDGKLDNLFYGVMSFIIERISNNYETPKTSVVPILSKLFIFFVSFVYADKHTIFLCESSACNYM
jgi:hypothetical protein